MMHFGSVLLHYFWVVQNVGFFVVPSLIIISLFYSHFLSLSVTFERSLWILLVNIHDSITAKCQRNLFITWNCKKRLFDKKIHQKMLNYCHMWWLEFKRRQSRCCFDVIIVAAAQPPPHTHNKNSSSNFQPQSQQYNSPNTLNPFNFFFSFW